MHQKPIHIKGMMTSTFSKPARLDVSNMDILKYGFKYLDYMFQTPFYCVTCACAHILNEVTSNTPTEKLIDWDIDVFNTATGVITPCVMENAHLLFPENNNNERDEKAKNYINHMVQYAFCNGVLTVERLQTPFPPFGFDSYVKSPIKSPPAPRLKLDETIPSLVDTGIGGGWINRSMNKDYDTFRLVSEIKEACYTHIEVEENLQRYSDQPHIGELFKKHGVEISGIIMCRLDHVFPLQKTKAWKEATAKYFYDALTSCEDLRSFEFDHMPYMKPYIHRNFCTMVPEGMENESNSIVTVPEMYSMLFTFLQGSKRRQALNFHLGSDVIRKIFDYLNIRTKDGVRWSSFNAITPAASSESTAGGADGC